MIIRRGSTMSAMAPAGSVNRKIGSVVAVRTSETPNGSRLKVVISQPDAVSYIAMPIIAQVLAVQTIANAGWAKAPSIGVALAGAPVPRAAPSLSRHPWQRGSPDAERHDRRKP